ncbi:MAG: chloride channel protein, partial [Verrucomicrobia bacterium]|nr:chloride channel protein [Verrucomicrobiota bacterium]
MMSLPKTVERLTATAREFFQRHWQEALRIRERLRLSEEAVHLLLAGGVGILGGFANLAFHLSNESVERFVLKHTGDPGEVAEMLVWWQRLLAPTLGGLAAGLVLYLAPRFIGRQGSTNLLEVVVAGDGRLPFRSGLVKVISSLLSISTGASVGREGLIVQLSATLASKWG